MVAAAAGLRLRDEAAERQRCRQLVAAAGEERPDLAQEDLQRRVVEDHVVQPHQREPAAVRELRHVRVDQRRPLDVQPIALLGHQRRDRIGGVAAQHHLLDGQRGAAPDHLHRLGQAAPHDRRAQDVVPVHHPLESVEERVEPGAGLEFEHDRQHVGVLVAARRGEQVVDEQAFLEGGERVDVGDVGGAAVDGGHEAVEMFGGEIDQREHVGSDHGGAGRDAVGLYQFDGLENVRTETVTPRRRRASTRRTASSE